MTDTRELELWRIVNKAFQNSIEKFGDIFAKDVTRDLLANGVTVQELDGCSRCKDSQKMTVTISNKLIGGVNTGWLGGNLPARYCPFCGRRLPQPPKGEQRND